MKKNNEHIHLELCHIRKIGLVATKKTRLYYLSRGYEGEKVVLYWIQKFGSESWLIIADYWFDNGKLLQADFIVVTEDTWYVIEVKNYDGDFQYKNYDCILNGKLLADNIMTKMQERMNRVKHMTSEMKRPIKVEGAMIFINEHSQVEIDSELDYDIVMRHQLRSYIKNMKSKSNYPLDPAYVKECQAIFDRYRVESPFQPESLKPESFASLKKGVTCCECDSFETVARYKMIECTRCGAKEMKSKTIMRVAYQLRYLYYDYPQIVTKHNLYEFMGGMIGSSAIRKTMSKHYPKIGESNKLYYKIEI